MGSQIYSEGNVSLCFYQLYVPASFHGQVLYAETHGSKLCLGTVCDAEEILSRHYLIPVSTDDRDLSERLEGGQNEM